MNTVEIFVIRLKTGEDVISYIERINKSKFNLINPVTFFVDEYDEEDSYRNVRMDFYLPLSLLHENYVELNWSDILWKSIPSEDFLKSYTALLDDYYNDDDVIEESSNVVKFTPNKKFH